MIRLDRPQYSFDETLDECVNGITGNTVLRSNVVSGKPSLITMGDQYSDKALVGELYTIPQVNDVANNDPIVVDALKRSDLVKIYEQYFVPNGKPARKIYDSLQNVAKEKCPFCGGIGMPHTLDHFLPKHNFPQFSVLPINLVPSCRDCNMGKKLTAFAINGEDQVIQPYTDDQKFFLVQWIYATYHAGTIDTPGEFEYYTDPPAGWSVVDKQRVGKHFHVFDLAKRYAVKAAENLRIFSGQIKAMRTNGVDNDEIERAILQPGVDSALSANHWQKGMFQALIQALRGGSSI